MGSESWLLSQLGACLAFKARSMLQRACLTTDLQGVSEEEWCSYWGCSRTALHHIFETARVVEAQLTNDHHIRSVEFVNRAAGPPGTGCTFE